MATDAAMLRVNARELNDKLASARVDKINMPARDEAVFSLRAPEGPFKLLISARSGSARIHITNEEFENPATPPPFCMLLRKHIGSGRLAGFRTVEGERLLLVDFDVTTETFERTRVTLSVELLGRYCNIALINANGAVIDALKRITAEDSDKRQLYAGCEFTLPPPQHKLDFLSAANDEIIPLVRASSKPLSSALLDVMSGISPLLCREIAHRTAAGDPCADALDDKAAERLGGVMDGVRAAADGCGERLCVAFDGERAVEFSFIELTQYEGCRLQFFESVGELYDCFFAERDRAERARARSSDLARKVGVLRERALRKRRARLEERDNSELAAQKRLFGELINANLHNIERGQTSVELYDYYSDKTVAAPLDPAKTPAQNAQKYFKDYRKLTTASKILSKLLAESAREIEYLESVSFELTLARTEEDFAAIRRELEQAGYLRGGRRRKEQKQKRRNDDILRYRTAAGLDVFVGRNNAANDRLTLKAADKRDIWLHAKGVAGAHVILATAGAPPDDASLETAACLAALHSSADASAPVEVDYTEARRVRKPSGARAGMVIYDSQRTVNVKPDPPALEALRVK